ncbi:DNA-binding transcriptional regulator, MarR family [Brevibacterium sandarakinum]|uniref:DNA-binding transcriptional regulator, MarR family n=1 Tax=Brevibacterium sandarakinum TaxID=629680 RepID=A0A1H1NXL0_BRESA|nr:MarR family winged helix-turn-helix transcriptional regulator [Brevibacterium sandarakinum]SDS03677.1 DNA-binding transcriptional regulator, MarR family [Brevibacterium sandarakinum]
MSTLGTGQLLFTFVRHWSRQAASGDATVAEQGRLVLVTEAVNSLAMRDEPATVNAIARELGIDQSGASRMIKTAVAAGYLEMMTGSADGRSREASMTSEGIVALEKAHAWQEQVLTELTAGWSQSRRNDFHSAMADLIARSYAIDA